jgi:hypothetical protein
MATYELVGPFRHRWVVINGWRVPFLEGCPVNGGKIALLLDDKFGVDIPVAQADSLLPFIADVMAVGLGHNGHPRSKDEPPIERGVYRRCHEVVTLQ